jgi:putative DNA primase/helicase
MTTNSNNLTDIDAGIQDLARITRLAWRALAEQNEPPELFRAGGNLSRVEPDEDGALLLRNLTLYRLRHELARRARFHKTDHQGHTQAAMPPLDVIRDLLATPDPPLPVLTRMIEVPVFTRDGTLQTEPGYSPGSRMYYAPPKGFHLPEVPRDPSAKDIARARPSSLTTCCVTSRLRTRVARPMPWPCSCCRRPGN